MPTVTLPGGGALKYVLPVGSDAKKALATAIKTEFNAAGKNITMNVVDSGAPGKAGFFNAVLDGSASNNALVAGKGVQAIFDLGTGADTLIGGASTSLIYANTQSTSGDSISMTGKATVFGTAGNDTLSVINGSATAYLGGGNDVVKLVGSSDTLTIAGKGMASIVGSGAQSTVFLGQGATTITAGSGAMSVVGGKGSINFTHGAGGDDTVSIAKNMGTDSLSGALGDSNGSDLFAISEKAGGKYVINAFSGTSDTIKITGATQKEITKALKDAHTVKSGGVTVTTLTIGHDKMTVIGGAVTSKNFTN
jgi:Ca2+-binding RTX toxin-like protein